MGRAVIRWNDDENKSRSRGSLTFIILTILQIFNLSECVRDYIGLVSAGLAGSTHMVSCSVMALTCILYEFRVDVDSDILKDIVEATCMLLRSKAKLIVESSLSLMKSLITTVDKDLVAQYLKDIVSLLEETNYEFLFY
jgi:ribosomal RNA-processing protein 12